VNRFVYRENSSFARFEVRELRLCSLRKTKENRLENFENMSVVISAFKRAIVYVVYLVAAQAVCAQPGANDPTFNTIDDCTFGDGSGFNGNVYTSAIQSDGKIILGGAFGIFNGVNAYRIARINSNGSLDESFYQGTGFNQTVLTSVIQNDGKILVGGFFTSYNGTNINRIARLNTDGSIDVTFNPGDGFDGTVNTIAIQPDGKLIVGGQFTSYNGTTRNRIARLNSDGTLDTGFDPGLGFDNAVFSISLQSNGKIVAGGNFSFFNGVSKNNIARINTNGSLDGTFDSGLGFDSWVHTTTIQPDGKIVLGGGFSSFNGTTLNRIARLNEDGTLDDSFNSGTGFDALVWSIAIQSDGKLILGGDFASFNGTSLNRIARLNGDGSLDLSFDSGTGFDSFLATVYTTSIQFDGDIIVGGQFTTYNGVTRNRLTRLSNDGSVDVAFNLAVGFNASVLTSAIQGDGKIIVGGVFTSFNNSALNRIARLNSDGTTDLTFNVGSGFTGNVHAIALQPDGKAIVGGLFNSYNGSSVSNIVRLNQDGTIDLTFDTGTTLNGVIFSISLQSDGKIIVGGAFTSLNGSTVNRIARLNSDGYVDITFNSGTGFNMSVNTISIQSDGKIIVGGDFNEFNGMPINRIARLNSDGSLDATFNTGTGFNEGVLTSYVQADGKIMLGGWFVNYNGISRSKIARLNQDGSLDASFNPGSGFYYFVSTICGQSDGKTIVGGDISTFNGVSINKITRLNADGSLDTTFDPGTGFNSNPTTISIQSDGKIIVGGGFTSYDGACRTRIVRLLNCSPNNGTDIITTCNSYTWIDGIEYTSSNNTATFILTNAAGCDSIVTLNLTIDTPVTADVLSNLTACDSYELPALTTGNYFTETNGGGTQLNAGDLVNATQTVYVYAENGTCSDETSFTVTINENPDNGISQNGLTLSVDAIGANYVWVDCNNAFAPITGETAQTFTATENGSYAVQISANGCEVVSECVEISTVSVGQITMSNLIVYPNPSEGVFVLESELLGIHYSIRDLQGRVVTTGTVQHNVTELNLTLEARGIYFLAIDNRVVKLIKE
jgi:uncharacterized delta-60 repeat protein